jgi:hypothetical protein
MKRKLEHLKDRLGQEIMITVKLTYVDESKSSILIGDEPLEVDSLDLLEAFQEAEDFLDENVDGG